MITWQRLIVARMCGYCGEVLKADTPAQAISLSGIKRVLIRCQACAGPAPPDLPTAPVLSARDLSAQFTPIRLEIPGALKRLERLPYVDDAKEFK